MNAAVQRYLDAASGFTELTRKRAEHTAKQLVRSGEAASDQMGELVEEMIERQKKNREAVSALVRSETERAIRSMGLASSEEVERLEKQVADLQRELQRSKGGAMKKTAKKGTKKAAAKKGTARKGTKKAAAKKGTKKAAAKKGTKKAAKKGTKKGTKKAAAKKGTKKATKKATARKGTAKKGTKKATAKRAPAKKATAKKATKKATAKKTSGTSS